MPPGITCAAQRCLTNAVGGSVDSSVGTDVYAASAGATPIATSTSTLAPGTVSAPQLQTVKVVKSTDVLGNASYTAHYTFNYAVVIGAANFNLYAADGTEYQLAGASRGVEHQRVAGPGVDGDGLIHPPAPDAHLIVLRP